MRSTGRAALVDYARQRLSRQEAAYGASGLRQKRALSVLDPEVLTLGFARRFATYKRPTLLLHDRERLARILTSVERPVQLILAGKAHPHDRPGQALVREWTEFVRSAGIRAHAVFLSDYDMLLAERLVEGVDVWINTPRRPWEASGTSGMKVLVNGGLNLSVRDGWWAEAWSPEVGWAIGDGQEHGDDPAADRADAEALYDVLENGVIPEFYERDERGIPRQWVARIRRSMATLTPQYSANRTVRQYTEQQYLPSAAAYAARSAGADAFLAWQAEIARSWSDVRFGAMRVETHDAELAFDVEVHLGGLDPAAVRVELYAEPLPGTPAVREPMKRLASTPETPGVHWYAVRTPATRAAADFTPRIRPHHRLALGPELDQVVWQK
jgi:starch phosphorylase